MPSSSLSSIASEAREIRVFLSSTFRDMDAERTYLVKQVFPKVRAACLERQVGFSEIDLRWGVSEEESKNGATVEICLKEIDRCRDFPPFFVGFLGERYGWVPRYDELAAYWEKHGDSQYATAIRQAIERSISVTELEMELAVLGEGAADKIANHALFCLRDAALTDTLYLEQTGKHADHNDPAFFDAGNGKLAALKANIRQSGYLGLDNYTSIEQFGDAVESYLLAQLDRYFPADAVPSAFERGNAAHAAFRFHRLQNFLPRPDVREHMIRAIEQRIDAPSLGPILVTGPSGQGKSALMADLARHLHNQSVANQPLPPRRGKAGMGVSNPIETTNATTATNPSTPSPTIPLPGGGSDKETETWRVIDHYIGADNGNHIEGWVERVLQTLHPDIADLVSGIPESLKDKIEALSTWISMAARRNHCRYLFVLDALDQLGDGGKNLDILTAQTLGPDGILIASAADGTLALTSAAGWQTHIEVPPLTGELRTRLVTDTLARYRKRLPENLAAKLAHAPQSGSPLFLGLALEELRVDARHETLDQLIDDILKQPDAEHLFLNNFLFDEDYGRPELPTLAASFMALLGAARAGLSENELADLLAMPDDPVAEDTGKPRLPQVHLSRLLNNLAPFLLNKQGRRAPMHRIFGKVALEHFNTAPIRTQIYEYFEHGYGKGENKFDARGAAEALFQITELAKLEYTKQKQARERLVEDLGYLHVPVKLHDDESNDSENLILDALDTLAESEQNQLKELWEIEIGTLDAEDAEEVAPAICAFGDWLGYWARYSLAETLLEALKTNLDSQMGSSSIRYKLAIASCCTSLAQCRTSLGKLDYVPPLLHIALYRREEILDANDLNIADSLNRLAGVLPKDDAMPMYQRALSIAEKKAGDGDLLVANILSNFAGMFAENGEFTQAEPLSRRALMIVGKVMGEEHPYTANVLNNLAGMLARKGAFFEAESMYRRVLAILLKSLGPAHPHTASTLNDLGELQFKNGNLVAAEALFRRALSIREKTLAAEHFETANSLCNLADLLKEKQDFVAAEQLYRNSLTIRQSSLGGSHPDSIYCLNKLTDLLKLQGKNHDADFLSNHAEVMNEVDECFEDIDRNDEMFELLYNHLNDLEKCVGKESKVTLEVMLKLGRFLGFFRREHEGEAVLREAIRRSEKTYGENSSDAADAYYELAILLKANGVIDEAKGLCSKVVMIRERELGSNAKQTKDANALLNMLL